MISVTAVTDKYILQPTLIAKHKETLDWLSAAVLWKRELAFFQKLLDKYGPLFTSPENKKQLSHFQNLIIYYNGELVNALTSQLRHHEKKLAEMLESRDETKTGYFKEHDGLMGDLQAAHAQFKAMKEELFWFIEQVV